ncbi:uncharacterized protein LOC143901662 [Temnothorax americanus]|uniref:uncharacterized protein LOC143901662 n=1 Tax=Temnothorax americanus TaxID=1964332 RepID=UPI004067D685
MMETKLLDTELFIDEIEKRPAIWNMECPDYRNRIKKKKSWEEIVEIFSTAGNTEEQKKLLGVKLQNKWKNIRDGYSKELKKLKNRPSGSGAEKQIANTYHTRLQFLEKSVSHKETTSNFVSDETETMLQENEDDPSCHKETDRSLKTKKMKLNATEKHFSDILQKSLLSRQKQEESYEDEDKLFCLSLHKELKKIPGEHRLMIKISIMETIQRAQNLYLPKPSFTIQS